MSFIFTVQTIIEVIIAVSILYCIAFEDKALTLVNKILGFIFQKDESDSEPADTVKNTRTKQEKKKAQYRSTKNAA